MEGSSGDLGPTFLPLPYRDMDMSATIPQHTNATERAPSLFGRIRIVPEMFVVGGIGALIVVVFLIGLIFWFFQWRLRRRQSAETEKKKERDREDFENRKGTPYNKKKNDKNNKDGTAKTTHQGTTNTEVDETIAEFENRVREQFSTSKVLEEIREEQQSTPKIDNHESISVVGRSSETLERNDSKVNVFNHPSDGEQPINLETI